jgi:hypothetical protein
VSIIQAYNFSDMYLLQALMAPALASNTPAGKPGRTETPQTLWELHEGKTAVAMTDTGTRIRTRIPLPRNRNITVRNTPDSGLSMYAGGAESILALVVAGGKSRV